MKLKRQLTAGATTGSIGLSALAAAVGLCCVAPWAVPLLGVSGAVALFGLSTDRIYFILAAVALFVLATWMAWRRRVASGTGACNRRPLWLVLLFGLNALLLVVAIFAGIINTIVQRHFLF